MADYYAWVKGVKTLIRNAQGYRFEEHASFVTFIGNVTGLPPIASFPVAEVSRILRDDQISDDDRRDE